MIVTVDWDPDENARYAKTIELATNYFTNQDQYAFFFLATNAPERSAFNKIERQMVKFSQELSGAVLHHNKFMSYLNYKRETIDPELENLCIRDRSQLKSGWV